jgi:hypothetical protein
MPYKELFHNLFPCLNITAIFLQFHPKCCNVLRIASSCPLLALDAPRAPFDPDASLTIYALHLQSTLFLKLPSCSKISISIISMALAGLSERAHLSCPLLALDAPRAPRPSRPFSSIRHLRPSSTYNPRFS